MACSNQLSLWLFPTPLPPHGMRRFFPAAHPAGQKYRGLMNFLSNVLREDGGFEYKKVGWRCCCWRCCCYWLGCQTCCYRPVLQWDRLLLHATAVPAVLHSVLPTCPSPATTMLVALVRTTTCRPMRTPPPLRCPAEHENHPSFAVCRPSWTPSWRCCRKSPRPRRWAWRRWGGRQAAAACKGCQQWRAGRRRCPLRRPHRCRCRFR